MSETSTSADELLATARGRIGEISVEQAKERHGDGVVFLDVRDTVEISERIPGSVHTSRGMVEFKADPESSYYEDFFDKENEYISYCVVGLRSTFVIDRLAEMGHDITNLERGIEAWERSWWQRRYR